MSAFGGIPAQYNKKSSAVKRIMQEARELVQEPSTDFSASPLEAKDTEFEGGLYHGRILLPNNYPFAPPSLMFLTPNGRFELNKKVCLSITGYHPEYWQPAWGIRTVLVAVMGFLPTESKGAIGGLDTSVEARKALALRSKAWKCQVCQQNNVDILPDVAPENAVKASLKAGEIPEFSFGYESDKKKNNQTSEEQEGQRTASTPAVTAAGLAAAARAHVAGSSSSSLTPSGPAEPTKSRPEPVIDSAQANASISHQAAPSSSSSPLLKSPAVGTEKTTAAAAATSHTSRSTTITTTTSSPTAAIPPQPAQGNSPRAPIRRTETGAPVWLDALILSLGGLLVAMIIRRFGLL
ncbi:hypothetical protein BGZ59_008687 [Podila verticillata]|nr:hypothetical protein BGZ59_008687 [Podila verticillata]